MRERERENEECDEDKNYAIKFNGKIIMILKSIYAGYFLLKIQMKIILIV